MSEVAALRAVEPAPGAIKPDPILSAEYVQRTFGGVHAVDIERLQAQRGVITALIGPNGAGKTTLFNLLTGFDRPDRGRWTFDGRDSTGWRPYRLAREGMVRTFQLTRSLSKLSVLENVMLGAQDQRGEFLPFAPIRALWGQEERRTRAAAMAQLETFGLLAMADEYAGTLSGGQRKLLELARALMAHPRLVMLDEPMAGVNPALTQTLLTHITRLPREAGMTVIFVEHDMDVVMEISDWVVVLSEGRVIAEGPPHVVAGNEAVIDAYLGRVEQGDDE